MAGRITHLERDSERLSFWSVETGAPSIDMFANAVQVWSIAQDRDVTVQEAALVFNVEPKLIVQAVEWHPWMFIGAGDRIEHDGE